MAQQQPIRVVVEKKPSGCWGALGVMLLVGLAIEYWYVSVGVLLLVVVVAALNQSKQKTQKKLEQEQQRHRRGPQDPWLNEVAVALADLGLTVQARNTGGQIGGVPIEGDIALEADRLAAFVTLFGSDKLARQAELALRAQPNVRAAESGGRSVVKAKGRVLYTANGRGDVVDPFRAEELIAVVDKISLPPSLPHGPAAAVTPGSRVAGSQSGAGEAPLGAAEPDALEQLRKLADLRAAGVLTDAEFEAKKAELLRRI